MRPIPGTDGVVVGSSLLAVGLLWTASNFGQLDLLRTLAIWWPLSLMLWGVLELYNWNATRRTP